MELTKNEVTALLNYDPETGVFTRIKSNSNAHKAGEPAGCVRPGSGYVYIKIGSRPYPAHRLAFVIMTGRWPENEVDHINGDRADNRWINLRPATRSQNMRNKATYKTSTSGTTGVHFHVRTRRWQARIQINGKRIALGSFDNQEDAVQERRRAEAAIHKEFAQSLSRPNVIACA